MNSGVAVKFGSEPSAELSELHSAALASLKGDIVELSKRLQQTERERDLLEKKLAKAQCEQSHLMREHEDVQERTTLRYEERITELHSIIAELNKKIDRLQGSTIREEDECSELRSELSQSQLEGNEDCRSLDQDQTSVSVPENQSTVVTADVEAGCMYSSTWTGTGRPSGRDPLLRRVPGAVGSRQREEKTA